MTSTKMLVSVAGRSEVYSALGAPHTRFAAYHGIEAKPKWSQRRIINKILYSGSIELDMHNICSFGVARSLKEVGSARTFTLSGQRDEALVKWKGERLDIHAHGRSLQFPPPFHNGSSIAFLSCAGPSRS